LGFGPCLAISSLEEEGCDDLCSQEEAKRVENPYKIRVDLYFSVSELGYETSPEAAFSRSHRPQHGSYMPVPFSHGHISAVWLFNLRGWRGITISTTNMEIYSLCIQRTVVDQRTFPQDKVLSIRRPPALKTVHFAKRKPRISLPLI
jgi:hypothetical protein